VVAPCAQSEAVIVDPAKLAGMRQVLARDGQVTFKSTGVVVRWDAEVDLLATFPDGSTRRVNEWAHDQFAQMYEIASTPPLPPEPPPPKIKPTRSRTDFGPCPF
jgi:hypothetical protein